MDLNEILKNPEQIKALISVLQGLVDQNDTPKEEEQKKHVADKKNGATIKTRGGRKVSGNNIGSKKISSSSTNEFEKMSEFRMHKDDCLIDKKLCKHPPVARMRDFEFVEVTCRICGKKEEVAPSLVFDAPSRYKCNNCSTQSG